MMEIRELSEAESGAALDLAWEVFMEFEAPDYAPRDAQVFYTSIHDPAYLAQLRIYGAFDVDVLAGILATRSGGTHIALFFVRGTYHCQGVGKQLFFRACRDNPTGQMTVNASRYAAEAYRRLEFCETDTEQKAGGIRYTPMRCVTRRADCPCKRTRCPRHGDCTACREQHRRDEKNPVWCRRPESAEKRQRGGDEE